MAGIFPLSILNCEEKMNRALEMLRVLLNEKGEALKGISVKL